MSEVIYLKGDKLRSGGGLSAPGFLQDWQKAFSSPSTGAHVWNVDATFGVDLPKLLAGMPAAGGLSTKTIAALKATFRNWGHEPSKAQWDGLRDLADKLAEMADGTAEHLYFLSSLDPGVGKTQTVVHFMQALLSSPDHSDVAAMICVGRLAEIEDYVSDMCLRPEQFAVLVSDDPKNDALNRKGNPDRDNARVLFTTQQMLESRAKRYGCFSDIKEFWFNGRPRLVRLWDEACLPARPLTIDVTLIEGMTDEARRQSGPLHDMLQDLIADIHMAKDEEFVSVPDLGETGVDLTRAAAIFGEEKKKVKEAVKDLYLLCGKTVVVKRNGRNGTVVHYENTLPDDLKPVVVCDASGRVRPVYSHWSNGRGDLVQLRHGPKDYSNLTIHIWNRGGSKTAWHDPKNAAELVEGIVATVNSKPDQQFLIVHHLQSRRFRIDVPSMIGQKAINPDRLRFIHWGGEDCRATNEFKDIENVILAGTLFFEPSHYEAVARLSRATPSDQRLDREHRKQIEQGEHANLILQALCRGSVRKSEGGKCGRCDVYIIAKPQHGFSAMLDSGHIFPGAIARRWLVEQESSGKVGEAVSFILNWFASQPDHWLPSEAPTLGLTEVRDGIGFTDNANFNHDIVGHPDFEAALRRHAIIMERRKGRGGSVLRRLFDNDNREGGDVSFAA